MKNAQIKILSFQAENFPYLVYSYYLIYERDRYLWLYQLLRINSQMVC